MAQRCTRLTCVRIDASPAPPGDSGGRDLRQASYLAEVPRSHEITSPHIGQSIVPQVSSYTRR